MISNASNVAERDSLRRDLLDLGFDTVRFAAADSVPPTQLRAWLEWGWQADMDWMTRTVEKRLDPGLILADVGTVVLFGVNYLPGEQGAAGQSRWARYALYEDYHDNILRAVRAGGGRMAARLGLGAGDWRAYVDTGPVMERGWAAKAGMGWLGKNGMLISRSHGNWLLLAAILIRGRIVPDEPLPGGRDMADGPPSLGRFCGSCVRCIEACPTGAIRQPGLIDAHRCLSWQTIENRGPITREFRESMGGRIFGCDICLEVCPWNRFAQAGRGLLLAARFDLAELTLIELLSLTPERFAVVFRRTPLKRLRLERLLRNACVVAGNLDRDEGWNGRLGGSRDHLLNGLVGLAGSSTALVRAHAVWAVYRLEPGRARAMLEGARAAETDETVLEEYAVWERTPHGIPTREP
ncbi:MAG: tRNA epoxyqueuosine(34) reductase QueG [Opitutaceae bacterium]